MANMRVNAVLDKSLSTESSGVHRDSWRSQTGDGREAVIRRWSMLCGSLLNLLFNRSCRFDVDEVVRFRGSSEAMHSRW